VVSASLVASRTSGYAPLAVHFDATGATSTISAINDLANGGTFRQITHAFDFGDAGAGTHSVSGLSRNAEPYGVGLAAHVYETPGTYSVIVTSTDGSGTDTETVSITVLDPSALTTYAISRTGDFTGAPTGSTHLTQTTMPTFQNNCRYYFRRGETWSVPMQVDGVKSNIYIGAFGSGSNPLFTYFYVGFFNINMVTDLRIADIDGANGFNVSNTFQTLFLRCNAHSPGIIGISSATHTQAAAEANPSAYLNMREVCFADVNVNGTGGSGYTFIGNGHRLSWINCGLGGTNLGDFRMGPLHDSSIRHCRIDDPVAEASVHAIKIHSTGTNTYNDNWLLSGGERTLPANGATCWVSERIVIADCELGGNGALANWTVAVCPQNSQNGSAGFEPMADVVIENNRFHHPSGWAGANKDIAWRGKRLTSRGNSVVSGSGAFAIGLGHSQTAEWDGPYFDDGAVDPPSNESPVANAGADQSITLPSTASLSGTATDDGLPSDTLTTTWSKVSGPGTVTFGNAALLSTASTFSEAGTYVLRLTATDGTLTTTDDVTITVAAATAPGTRRVPGKWWRRLIFW
jgi:PKD repeat protein